MNSRLMVQLPAGGMEICRLLAAAAAVSGSYPVPALKLAAILLAALLASRLLASIPRRLAADAAVHLFGAAASLCIILPPFSSFSGADPDQKLLYAAWAFFALLFWFRGAQIGYSESSYSRTVSQFDIGLGLIIFIAFITTAADYAPDHLAQITGAYLIFGMVSLFAARTADADKGFSSSHVSFRVLGAVLVTAVTAGAGVIFLLPVFSDTAESVFRSLRDGSAPLRSWLTALLIRILNSGRMRADPAGGSGEIGMSEGGGAVPASDQFTGKFLLWFVYGILALAACYLIIIGIRALYRFLLKKTSPDQQLSLRQLAAQYLRRLNMIFRRLRNKLKRKYLPGAAAFRTLRRWGRRTGIRKGTSETAAEYGSRIKEQIPGMEQAVDVIVQMAHREWYQERMLTPADVRELKAAGRTLISPALYPARLRRRLRLNLRREPDFR